MSYFGDGGIIHATRDYAIEPGRNGYRTHDNVCAMYNCNRRIGYRSTYCKPCAQKMRRKIEGQVRRLLALRDMRQAEREAVT